MSTHFKVCDDGLYQILDKDGDVIWDSIQTCHYYVPSFLSIEDEGYGDYLYIDIDGDGNIAHWNTALRKIEYLLENDDD